MIIDANLDCEARWSGLALPAAVRARISLYGLLLAVLAPPDDEVELWTPAPVDLARWRGRPVSTRAGTPPRCDLRWADPDARAANDRRLALAVAALPGARTITRVDELAVPGPWVAKAPWTAAGRDRCRGAGPPTAAQRARLGRLLAACGALVVEPWCERVLDLGVCATVARDGTVTADPPHQLGVDARGGFAGIDLAPPALTDGEAHELAAAVDAAGAAIAGAGYAGPFTVDGFVFRDGPARRLHAPCEINARRSFGAIARAYAARTGATRLGLTGAPPPGATVLIAPGDDHVTAWIA